MEEAISLHLQPPFSATLTSSTTIQTETETESELNDLVSYLDNADYHDDSNYSTPYVSAPSSPSNRTSTTFLSPSFFFYSAPTSPIHYAAVDGGGRTALAPASSDASSAAGSFEFEFSSRRDSPAAPGICAAMSSADELFLNGQIRPMKHCAHLSRPQHGELVEDDDNDRKPRDLKLRNRSQRRRTRSMSPSRNTSPFDWITPSCDDVTVSNPKKSIEEREIDADAEKDEVKISTSSTSSSRCSSAGRSSKRWLFLKEFLRSKSEGRSNNKFWQNINISFSPSKEKEKEKKTPANAVAETATKKMSPSLTKKTSSAAKRRSAHEVHYEAKRAQAEEMRRKTFLPYRQGLLGGCLGFNSKGYGALSGFAKTLNPVSSR